MGAGGAAGAPRPSRGGGWGPRVGFSLSSWAPPHRLAVPGEHRQLVVEQGQVAGGEEVAGVAVLGHHPEGPALAAAADEDRRVRALDRRRRAERALQLVVL